MFQVLLFIGLSLAEPSGKDEFSPLDPETPAVSTQQSYIKTTTYRLTNSHATDIAYYDDFGYNNQTIAQNATGDGAKNLVSFQTLDFLHRPKRRYLPYPVNSNAGGYILSPEASQKSFYRNLYGLSYGQEYSWTSQLYEPVAGDRVIASYDCGANYQSDAHSARYHYCGNASQSIPIITINSSTGALSISSYYPANALSCNELTDADGNILSIWTDKNGKTICEQKGLAKTLFGYDDCGRLRWIISPEGVALLHSGSSHTMFDSFANQWCFRYDYDSAGRQVIKRIPGCSEQYYVYDKLDRVVMSQDGNLRNDNKWLVCLYDNFGRPTEERLVSGVATRSSLQSGFDSGQIPSLYSASGTILRQWHYDDYSLSPSFNGFNIVPGVSSSLDSRTSGLLTVEKINVLGTSNYVWRTFYYDSKGNIIQTVESRPDGSLLRTSVSFDNQGNVLASSKSCQKPGAIQGGNVTLFDSYGYDSRGRILSGCSTLSTEGDSLTNSMAYVYDNLGRLSQVLYGGEDTVIATQNNAYSLQGKETYREVRDEGDSLIFRSDLYYEKPLSSDGIIPATNNVYYSGKVSGWSWKYSGDERKTYAFTYDNQSRLTNTTQYSGAVLQNKFRENIVYDLNSNITSITRNNGSTSPEVLSFTYNGNQRAAYTYDDSGNVTSTGGNAIISYNNLNLPDYVSSGNNNYLNITYLADGTKLSSIGSDSKGYYYAGPFRYKINGSSIRLDSSEAAGGRIGCIEGQGGTPTLQMSNQYFVLDHLGSIRAVFDGGGEVTSKANYLPFGETWVTDSLHLPQNNYLWFSKERIMQAFDSPVYDNQARFLGTDGLFLSIDPLAEKYPFLTPYSYCGGNPINCIDINGANWYSREGANGEIEYRFVQGQMSEKERASGGYKDLGFTYIDDNGNYYSLFGQILPLFSSDGSLTYGQIYSKIDELIIRQAKYKLSSDSLSPFDAEGSSQPAIDTTIDNVTPGCYSFVYAGIDFRSEKEGTIYNVIEPNGMQVFGQLVTGDPFVTVYMSPSCGYITRGGSNTVSPLAKNYSGYFLVAQPRSGRRFDAIQVRFGDKKNADAFLSACKAILGTSSL